MKYENRIQQARKATGMSQSEAAALLGKSQPTLSGWEKGDYQPDLSDIYAMCEIFSVTPNQLLGFDIENEPPIETKPKGAFLTYRDGTIVLLTPQEEFCLMKCLIEVREGQTNKQAIERYGGQGKTTSTA